MNPGNTRVQAVDRARVAPPSTPGLTPTLVLLLTATACAAEVPMTAPEVDATAPAAAAIVAFVPDKRPAASVNDVLDDALLRLAPSLGPQSKPLRAVLARLKGQREDPAAWADMRGAVEALSATISDEHRPDFDALLLGLGIELSK